MRLLFLGCFLFRLRLGGSAELFPDGRFFLSCLLSLFTPDVFQRGCQLSIATLRLSCCMTAMDGEHWLSVPCDRVSLNTDIELYHGLVGLHGGLIGGAHTIIGIGDLTFEAVHDRLFDFLLFGS